MDVLYAAALDARTKGSLPKQRDKDRVKYGGQWFEVSTGTLVHQLRQKGRKKLHADLYNALKRHDWGLYKDDEGTWRLPKVEERRNWSDSEYAAALNSRPEGSPPKFRDTDWVGLDLVPTGHLVSQLTSEGRAKTPEQVLIDALERHGREGYRDPEKKWKIRPRGQTATAGDSDARGFGVGTAHAAVQDYAPPAQRYAPVGALVSNPWAMPAQSHYDALSYGGMTGQPVSWYTSAAQPPGWGTQTTQPTSDAASQQNPYPPGSGYGQTGHGYGHAMSDMTRSIAHPSLSAGQYPNPNNPVNAQHFLYEGRPHGSSSGHDSQQHGYQHPFSYPAHQSHNLRGNGPAQ